MSRPGGRALLIVAGVVVAATIAAALVQTGLPGAQRQARIDERRVQDLQRIDSAIQAHAHQHDALPAGLDRLDPATAGQLSLTDPETATPYEYVTVDAQRYRLCAVFATGGPGRGGYDPTGGWAHPPGAHCFQRRVDRGGAR